MKINATGIIDYAPPPYIPNLNSKILHTLESFLSSWFSVDASALWLHLWSKLHLCCWSMQQSVL